MVSKKTALVIILFIALSLCVIYLPDSSLFSVETHFHEKTTRCAIYLDDLKETVSSVGKSTLNISLSSHVLFLSSHVLFCLVVFISKRERKRDNATTGFGKLGKHGDLGFETRRVRFEDLSYRHGVSMHPPPSGRAYATYKDVPPGTKFKAVVGINDNNNFFEMAGGPITFRLEIQTQSGEKKNIYESHSVQKARDLQIVDVNLPNDMSVLTLIVEAEGSNACAHAVWANALYVRNTKECTNSSQKSAVRSGLRVEKKTSP